MYIYNSAPNSVKLRTSKNKLPFSVAIMMPDIGFMTLHNHFCLKPTPIHTCTVRIGPGAATYSSWTHSRQTQLNSLTHTWTDQRTATEHVRTTEHFLVIDQQVWTHCSGWTMQQIMSLFAVNWRVNSRL